jgi:hypothetical protein
MRDDHLIALSKLPVAASCRSLLNAGFTGEVPAAISDPDWRTGEDGGVLALRATMRPPRWDQRNANGGESTGPVPISNPWDAFADDQLGLMDHPGVNQFLGYRIGGCFAGKLMQRAPCSAKPSAIDLKTRP